MKNIEFNKLLAIFIGMCMIVLALIYFFSANVDFTMRIMVAFVVLLFGSFITLLAIKS